MSLRRTKPLTFHPRGLSDALDSSLVFTGAMNSLKDLIPDPSTKGLWECRPAGVLIGDAGGTAGAFSSGFSSGFLIPTTSIYPAPVGVISALLIVGNIAYGMVMAGSGTPQQDYPFAFNLLTNTFVTVNGITPGTGGNLPTAQLAAGDWVPPTMDVIGSTIMVTHPGFAGTPNWLGSIDISNTAAPVWSAGNLNAPSGFTFTATTGVPVAVKAFNGRAWWAFNPVSGPSGAIFSDQLTPLTVSNNQVPQAVTFDDNVPITALGALPLSNQLGGIIQSLMVFKGVTNIYQITGDISINSTGTGSFGTLARNTLNVATGTFAPNSIAATTKGLAFVAPDGVRIIDFNANVSDPIGNDGSGKTLPFLLAVSPSRIAAAANGTIYRVSVQDGSLPGSPIVEYWLDFSRQMIWSGPHSLPGRVIKPWRNTFITAPYVNNSALFQSDYLQSAASSFVENNVQMSFDWQTCPMPDTDQMSENNMLEATIYLSQAPGGSYTVRALNESGSVLGGGSVTLKSVSGPTLWGATSPPGFIWGQADWGGVPSALFPQRLAWSRPVVFRRLAMDVTGLSSQQFRIGTLHMRYEQLGYLQQPLGSAA